MQSRSPGLWVLALTPLPDQLVSGSGARSPRTVAGAATAWVPCGLAHPVFPFIHPRRRGNFSSPPLCGRGRQIVKPTAPRCSAFATGFVFKSNAHLRTRYTRIQGYRLGEDLIVNGRTPDANDVKPLNHEISDGLFENPVLFFWEKLI